jgi:hypothetical protein
LYLREIPDFFKDVNVFGDFSIEYGMLENLKNCPIKVVGLFQIYNCGLKSLEGMPEEIVSGSIYLSRNNLKTLEFFTQDTNNIGALAINNNKLTSLNGLNISNINGSFNCSNNQLTSLESAPQTIWGGLFADGNPLTTTDGFPKFVAGDVYVSKNTLSKKQILEVCRVAGQIVMI